MPTFLLPQLRRRLITLLNDWIRLHHLTRREAARRLQAPIDTIHNLVRGETHSLSLDTLLVLWAHSGGHYDLTLNHPDLPG